MRTAAPTSPVATTVAILGGLAFVASLAWGFYVYVWEFGQAPGPWMPGTGQRALLVNTVLFAAFAFHHSAFARRPVKAWVTARVPAGLERTFYVTVASVLFAGLLAWWEPVPGVAWRVAGAMGLALSLVQVGGVALTLYAARQLGVLALAGLTAGGSPPSPSPHARPADPPPVLRETGLYGWVRHPIYFAWLLMVWPSPIMTGSRLLFAVLSTAYLVIAVPFEERTLARDVGPAYAAYRARVRWRMVPFLY